MSYEVLPQLSPETVEWVIDVFGEQMGTEISGVTAWMETELASLQQTNPALADLLKYYMADFRHILERCQVSNLEQIMLQAAGYSGLFVVLRAVDLELRRRAAP